MIILNLDNLNKQNTQKTTEYYLNSLTKAANEVYFQGVGASKKIYFYVPNGIDANKTGVSNNTVYMELFGSTIYSKSDINLIGELPTSMGGHYLYLRTYPDYVLISPSIVVVNKEVLYELMGKNALYVDPLSITNYSDENATIKLYLTWSNPLVNLTIDTNSFSLAQMETKTINVVVNTQQFASGLYFGNLRVAADFPTFEDLNIDIPITVDVVSGYGSEIASCLSVNPPKKTITVYKGDSVSYSFTICNICIEDQNNIVFTTNSLDINRLTYPTTKIDTIASSDCILKDITAHPKLSDPSGLYSGTVTLTSDSEEDATIDLNLTVQPYKWNVFAYDDFSSGGYSGGSGWGGDWSKTGQVSIVTTNTPHSPSYQLELLKGGSVNRFITFYGRNKPKLEFWAKITGFIPGDEAYMKISTTYFFWTTVKTWTVLDSTSTYTLNRVDLTNYSNAPLFWVQFSRNSNNNTIASLDVDDVNVFETLPA